MKSFFLLLLLAVGPLVAIGADVPPAAAATASNTTEKATVKSETNLESLQHSPTTDSTAPKDNHLHQQQPKPEEPAAKRMNITPFLHRIPVYENRNPLVETISKLESQLKQSAPEPKANDATDNSSSGTQLELPIPSRCPHITGTAEAEHNKNELAILLGTSSKPKAAQRGCRFFIMNELMDRSRPTVAHANSEEQLKFNLNRTLEHCLKSCTQAYDNGTDVCEACFDGCRKTAQVTEAAKKALSSHDNDELEREDESEHGGNMHRTFSIIIPLRPIESDEDSKDSPAGQGPDAFPSMMPNAIKMMLQMMHQMTERARVAMMQRAQDQSPLNGHGNIQESETSIDQSGNSISVSRSMSVLMTKDKDGHSKMLVVHTLPKIQIHRLGQNPFDSDEDDDLISIPRDSAASNHETEDDDDELTDVKLYGQVSNGHHRGGNSHQSKDGKKMIGNGQWFVYRSNGLCYYLPRLFYLTLIILILYIVFWLFCTVPAMYYARNNRRASSDSGVAIIASGLNADGKRNKFFFTRNARYFALNNKRNSTTSLPPPYPGMEDGANGGSCAEPLPEKQPLPEGGLEIKPAGDNK